MTTPRSRSPRRGRGPAVVAVVTAVTRVFGPVTVERIIVRPPAEQLFLSDGPIERDPDAR